MLFFFHPTTTEESLRDPILRTPPALFPARRVTQVPGDKPQPLHAAVEIRKSINESPHSFPMALILGKSLVSGTLLNSQG